MVTVRNEALNQTSKKNQASKTNGAVRAGMAILLPLVCLWAGVTTGAGSLAAQSSANQPQQSTSSQPDTDVPDAPTVQPTPTPAQPVEVPKPAEKKAAPELNPWTNQPNSKPVSAPDTNSAEERPAAPPMPPVRTVPPGSSQVPRSQEDLYTLRVHTNFVQLPVTVKDGSGRSVDGLLPDDFVVKENGAVQKLTFFSADPFALSVAVILDLGMPDIAVQKVNQTFSALVGSFAPYDEVALYTYSSTVSEVSDYTAASQKLTALLNQMKMERGHNNGVPVMSGPMASGPIINGIPVGSPTTGVSTPPKESHVLNDAILRAALDLRRRDRKLRKIIFVISDGREYGSEASFKDVLKVLLSNEIQVKAIAVDSGALPVYSKLERLRLPHEGYDDILPKYVSATGGGKVDKEMSQNGIENTYGEVMGEARNQYTLGYTPAPLKTPSHDPCRDVEVLVRRSGLKIYAKQRYCPALAR